MKYQNNPLRELARDEYWQTLYSRAKELNLKLFNNDSDLSKLQIVFLQFLELYSSLYTDLAMKESLISEEIIADDIRCDAYLTYKRKHRNEDKTKIDERKINTKGIPSISFVTPKKRR